MNFPIEFQSQRILFAIFTCFYAMSVITPMLGGQLIDASIWNPKLLYKVYLAESQFSLFISNDTSRTTVCNLADTEPIFKNIFFASGQLIVNLCRSISGGMIDLIFPTASITAWVCAKQFQKFIVQFDNTNSCKEDSNKQSYANTGREVHLVLQKYKNMKIIVNAINEACGISCLLYTVQSIIFYANHIGEVLVVPDWFNKFRVALFLANCSCSFVLAADMCAKVSILLFLIIFNKYRVSAPLRTLYLYSTVYILNHRWSA